MALVPSVLAGQIESALLAAKANPPATIGFKIKGN